MAIFSNSNDIIHFFVLKEFISLINIKNMTFKIAELEIVNMIIIISQGYEYYKLTFRKCGKMTDLLNKNVFPVVLVLLF